VSDILPTDEDLAHEINAEHDLVETYKHNTIRHAIRRGELPREMKRRVGHGNRPARAREHFGASERTARNHKIAKSAAVADLSQDTTMRSALCALASPAKPSTGHRGKHAGPRPTCSGWPQRSRSARREPHRRVFWVASARPAPATGPVGAGRPCPATKRSARTASGRAFEDGNAQSFWA